MLLNVKTHLHIDEDGKLTLISLSRIRLTWLLTVQAVRLVVAGFLLYWGCLYIVFTFNVGNLMLNCVALAFVISFDELIYEAFAPLSIQKLLREAASLRLPVRLSLGGESARSALTLVGSFAVVLYMIISQLDPQITLMVRARDALCAGDTQFVYSVDGAGAVVWGYPDRVVNKPDFANHTYSRNYPDGGVPNKTRGAETKVFRTDPGTVTSGYTYVVLDALLRQQGRPVWHCEPEECFDFQNKQAPLPNRPDCCLAAKTRAYSIDSGRFSVRMRTGQSAVDAVRLWNPSCNDVVDIGGGGFVDILRGSLADTYNHQGLQSTNCTGCPADTPFCLNGYCIVPTCDTVRAHCSDATEMGERVRQLCPQTCGCDDPLSPLTLFQPDAGCGASCTTSGRYLARRQAMPCVDLPPTDLAFAAYLDDWDRVRGSWPLDFAATSRWTILFLRTYGCQYLGNFSFPEGQGPPPYRFGQNICVENGEPRPIKPLSYFCPVACGCRRGQAHCPDTCPSQSASEPACPTFQRTAYADPHSSLPGACPLVAEHDRVSVFGGVIGSSVPSLD